MCHIKNQLRVSNNIVYCRIPLTKISNQLLSIIDDNTTAPNILEPTDELNDWLRLFISLLRMSKIKIQLYGRFCQCQVSPTHVLGVLSL